MADLLPPPALTKPVRCPSCGHGIDDHLGTGCRGLAPDGPVRDCDCRWTPNDIAWQLVYGNLTPLPPPQASHRPGGLPW